jgi:hypothetical protein
MEYILPGVIFPVLGLWFVLMNKQLGRMTRDFYSGWFELFEVEQSEILYRIGFFLVGTAFFVFGILALFGLIKFKS